MTYFDTMGYNMIQLDTIRGILRDILGYMTQYHVGVSENVLYLQIPFQQGT